jgi:hypothetical protein
MRGDLPGQLHLYGARRVGGTRVQLRVDGKPEGEVPIAASLDFALDDSFAIASEVPVNRFDGALAAVVIVRGPLADQEVSDLETFLIRSLGPDAAPF